MATKGKLPPAAGRGRPKGSENKVTKELKDMILAALDESGGVEYLKIQATENATAFMALIGRVLPLTIKGPGEDGAHELVIRWGGGK